MLERIITIIAIADRCQKNFLSTCIKTPEKNGLSIWSCPTIKILRKGKNIKNYTVVTIIFIVPGCQRKTQLMSTFAANIKHCSF